MTDEIFNEYAKLMIEQGFIVEAEEKPKAKTRNNLSDDAVRLLYGIEPESMYKDKTLLDDAHPEPCSVGNSYDPMNSIIENLNERQNIMTYIALKTPNGQLTQTRYLHTKAELINSLVRTAFALDNRDETDLMNLADSCCEKLSSSKEDIKKEAAVPLLLAAAPWVIAAGAILGTVYYFRYSGTSIQNVYANGNKVLECLQPLISRPYAKGIQQDVTDLVKAAQQVYFVKDELTKVNSISDVVDTAQSHVEEDKHTEISNKIEAYIKLLQKVAAQKDSWIAKIQLAHSTDAETSQDWYAKIKGIVGLVTYTDAQTLIDHLNGLFGAIAKDIELMTKAKNFAAQQTPHIENLIVEKTKNNT